MALFSFIKKPLDRSFGRFLEGFVLYFDVRNLAVRRNETVEFLQVSFHDSLNLIECHSLGKCLIREDECYEFAFAFHDQRLASKGKIARYVAIFLIIKEPKFYLREYEPRKNSGIRGLSLRTEGAFGNAVFEGLHTPRSALGSLIIAKFHFALQKNAQKLAYVQFLLYLCSRKGFGI